MKLKYWAKSQTISILKQVCISLATILFPISAALLVWNQSSHFRALKAGNQKVIVSALQTGDLVQLEKAMSGFKLDESLYGYDLTDRHGIVIKSYRTSGSLKINFNSSFPIEASDGEVWGNLILFWPPPWIEIILFALVSLAIAGVVGIIVYRSWSRFADHLVRSLEQIKDFSNIDRAPDFIEKIDDFKSVFNSLKRLQEKELSIERIKAERAMELEIIALSNRVAHDLRSPMSALSIVLYGSDLDQDRKKLANNAFQRMSEICNDLLATKKSSSTPKEKISQAITQVESEFRLSHPNIEFTAEIEPSIEKILIPDHEFKSVVSNLLNNASEACKESGKVRLVANKSENTLFVTILDNGHGIPDHIVEQLGNRPITYGKSDQGNGLGFYNAKNWVRRHGGLLKVSSTQNVGTRIAIELPILS